MNMRAVGIARAFADSRRTIQSGIVDANSAACPEDIRCSAHAIAT